MITTSNCQLFIHDIDALLFECNDISDRWLSGEVIWYQDVISHAVQMPPIIQRWGKPRTLTCQRQLLLAATQSTFSRTRPLPRRPASLDRRRRRTPNYWSSLRQERPGWTSPTMPSTLTTCRRRRIHKYRRKRTEGYNSSSFDSSLFLFGRTRHLWWAGEIPRRW